MILWGHFLSTELQGNIFAKSKFSNLIGSRLESFSTSPPHPNSLSRKLTCRNIALTAGRLRDGGLCKVMKSSRIGVSLGGALEEICFHLLPFTLFCHVGTWHPSHLQAAARRKRRPHRYHACCKNFGPELQIPELGENKLLISLSSHPQKIPTGKKKSKHITLLTHPTQNS